MADAAVYPDEFYCIMVSLSGCFHIGNKNGFLFSHSRFKEAWHYCTFLPNDEATWRSVGLSALQNLELEFGDC